MVLDGISAIAVIVIGSFAIDRIVTGLMFMLSFAKPYARRFPDPATRNDASERLDAEKKQKLMYFALAGTLGIVVLAGYGEVRIFTALGFRNINYLLDTVATGLILVAGADRVEGFLKLGGQGGARSEPRPVEIRGTLMLVGDAAKKAVVEEA